MKAGKLVACFLVLVFVSGFLGATGYAQKQKELRIQADGWIVEKFQMYEAAKNFEAAHPDVKVIVSKKDPQASTQGYLLQWKTGKTNVDLAVGVEPSRLSPLVEANLLVPWDDWFTGEFSRDKFVAAFLDDGIFHGKQYVFPFMGEVMFISANKAMFKEAGLVDKQGNIIPPKSWDELYEYAKKLTVKDVSGKTVRYGLHINWGWNFLMQTFCSGLQASRGNIYAADGKSIAFDSPEALEFLTFAQKVVQDGYCGAGSIADNNVPRNDFKAGTAAMIWEAHSRFMEGVPTLGTENCTVLPIPGSDKRGTLAYGHAVYIPKASPVPELAKAFVKEQMMQKWFSAWTWERYAKLPVLRANYEGLAFPEITKQILQAAEKATYTPKYRDYNELDSLCQREIQNMILGKQTPKQALDNIIKASKNLNLTRLED